MNLLESLFSRLGKYSFKEWYVGTTSLIGTIAALATILAFFFPASMTSLLSRVVESTTELNEKVAQLDPEVSADPIIQIRKRGYDVREWGFHQAILNGDMTSIELFCQTNIRFQYYPSTLFSLDSKLIEPARSLVLKCRPPDTKVLCEEFYQLNYPHSYNPTHNYKDYSNVPALKQFCGASFIQNLDEAIVDARARIKLSCQKEFDTSDRFERNSSAFWGRCGDPKKYKNE